MLRLRQKELTEYSKRYQAQPPASERLFISFKYETGVTAPGLPKRADRHLPLLCPFETNQTYCGHCGYPFIAPIHIPCFNHKINLVLTHSIHDNPMLARTVDLLRQFSAAANSSDNQRVLQKHCPVFIQTRWLSLSYICSYIRIKRNIILGNNYLTPSQILTIFQLEILLTPLFELHLFLEREQTKMYEVFPAILRTLLQYERIIDSDAFATMDWCGAIYSFLHYLCLLTLSGTTGNLIALAFSLTPVGTYLFQQGKFSSGFNPNRSILDSAQVLFYLLLSFIYLVFSFPREQDPPLGGFLMPATIDAAFVPLLSSRLMPQSADSFMHEERVDTTSVIESPALRQSQSDTADLPHPFNREPPLGCFFDDIPSTPRSLPLHKEHLFSVSSIKASYKAARFDSIASVPCPEISSPMDDTRTLRERNRMTLAELLTLIGLFRAEKVKLGDKPNADENEEMNGYGLLEAEEAAAADMYEEAKREDRDGDELVRMPIRPPLSLPELSQRALHRSRRINRRMAYSAPRRQRVENLSSSDSDSDSILEIEPTPEILSLDALGIKPNLAPKPEQLSLCLHNIFTELSHHWYEKLTGGFSAYIGRVILDDDKSMIPELIETHRKRLVSNQSSTFITSLDTYLSSLMRIENPAVVFYACLVRHIIFAPCSESSVERIFSKLRFICGKHRYNLSLKSLNASLVIDSQRQLLERNQKTEDPSDASRCRAMPSKPYSPTIALEVTTIADEASSSQSHFSSSVASFNQSSSLSATVQKETTAITHSTMAGTSSEFSSSNSSSSASVASSTTQHNPDATLAASSPPNPFTTTSTPNPVTPTTDSFATASTRSSATTTTSSSSGSYFSLSAPRETVSVKALLKPS